jgi:transglutaminase-like putative cysteine protease
VEGVEVVAEGVVETQDAAGVVRGLGRSRAHAVFLRDTPLTEPDPAVRALGDRARATAEAEGPLSTLHALMRGVAGAVEYRPGATDASTPAARALALGAGVCQDHAHVFISAARCLGLPARYVAGYLLARDDDVVELHETHGWTEVWVPDLGWVGFDPSNGVCPTERYVRVAAGLDARGAAPIRGSVTGRSEETLEADVAITPAAGQSQQ